MKCKVCGTDHRGVARHGGYCLDHQERRAQVAETRADLAEARILELQARVDMLEAEVMQQHHIATACAEA